MSRYVPHVVYSKRSPNQSSRNGVRPSIIVLHSTESDNVHGTDRDLQNVCDFLCRPATQASSNVIVDSDGHSARLVADEAKAWAQAAYNPYALSIEQIGRAASEHWTRDEIRETARWIARWSKKYAIPIQVGAVWSGSVTRPGVVTHKMLGQLGGGHVDPGAAYPIDLALALARFYRGKL
jgi:hypothetical protein